jgi:hypothetical protein
MEEEREERKLLPVKLHYSSEEFLCFSDAIDGKCEE